MATDVQTQVPFGQPPAYAITKTAGEVKLGDNYASALANRAGLLIKQTMKGCCCNVINEFSIHEFNPDFSQYENPGDEIMFASESAGCFMRCVSHFAPGFRPTSYDVWGGAHSHKSQEGAVPPTEQMMLSHSKGCTNGVCCWIAQGDGGPVRIPCCCCLPYFETYDAQTQQMIGRTNYLCDMCIFVPKYEVQSPTGEPWYRIRPEVCCGGCCVKCQCTGARGRCFAIPFYIRDPRAPYDFLEGEEAGSKAEITNLWSGVGKECCRRQNYALRFPKGATEQQKATLMGSMFLMEMLQYEQEGT